MRGINIVNVIGSPLLSNGRASENCILPKGLYSIILKEKQPGN